jgi:hypothetical protein
MKICHLLPLVDPVLHVLVLRVHGVAEFQLQLRQHLYSTRFGITNGIITEAGSAKLKRNINCMRDVGSPSLTFLLLLAKNMLSN